MSLALVSTALALSSNEAAQHDARRTAFVEEINNMPSNTWRAAIHSRFAGTPIGSSKSLCGVKPGAKAALDELVRIGKVKKIKSSAGLLSGTAVPESFDSATNPAWKACHKVIADIRDQSNCGCCWAFGAASAASDRLCIATNGTVALPLSAEDVCFCGSDDGCNGGFLPDAWEYIMSQGAVTGGQQGGGPFDSLGLCSDFSLPHCHHHGPQGDDPYPAEGAAGCPSQSSPSCPTTCDSDAKAPHKSFAADKFKFSGDVATYQDVASIQHAIMTNGPVEAAFTVYSDFENYASGVYQHTGGEQLGGHAIRIVGWGVDAGTPYWKVANSWNPYWGESGYFRIKRGTNECGIEEQVVSSSSKSTWTGGSLPPAPPSPSGCTGAMRTFCGEAKSAGASICRGCCIAYSDDLDKAGCSQTDEDTWCASGQESATPNRFAAAQTALKTAVAAHNASQPATGYYSFTFTGDGCGGQCPTSGCYQEDMDCESCLESWRSFPPDTSYEYNAIASHGCAGEKVDCPECAGMMGLSRYDK
jgi:cathepsin B